MASHPIGKGELPFKIPTGIDALKAIDATFWQLHARWQLLEDEFENYPGFPDEDPVAARMLDQASAARDAMFGRGVWTGAALLAKLEAVAAGGGSMVAEQDLQAGFTVLDMLQGDAGRIFQREAGLWDPMLVQL